MKSYRSQKTEDRDEVLLRALRTKSSTKLLRTQTKFCLRPIFESQDEVHTSSQQRINEETKFRLRQRRSPLRRKRSSDFATSTLDIYTGLTKFSSPRTSSLLHWILGNLRTTRTYEPSWVIRLSPARE